MSNTRDVRLGRARGATRIPRAIACAAAALLACGCAERQNVESRFVKGASPKAVSILGVYMNGQMVAIGKDAAFAGWLGGASSACPAAYAPSFFASRPTLSAAIDRYSQANGPTSELLERLAPAARGDTILVISLVGESWKNVRSLVSLDDVLRTVAQVAAASQGDISGGAEPTRGYDAWLSYRTPATLEADALLYSVPERRWIGKISVQYQGDKTDRALARFSEELTRTLRGAACGAWDWGTPIDADAIAASVERP